MFHCVNWSPIEQFIIIQNSTINRPGVDSVVDLLASKKVLDVMLCCDDALETC